MRPSLYIRSPRAGPNIIDLIKSNEVDMLINTSFGIQSIADSYSLRRSSLEHGVPYFTTVAGARGRHQGIKTISSKGRP